MSPFYYSDLILSYHEVGVNLRKLGRFQEAQEHFQNALEMFEKGLQNNCIDLDILMHHIIALIYADLNKHQEALEHFQKSYEMAKNILPPEDLYLVTTYIKLGQTLIKLGRYNEGVEMLQNSLKMAEVLSSDHYLLPVIQQNLGLVLKNELGRPKEAIEFFLGALRTGEKTFPSTHLFFESIHRNLALCFKDLERPQEALEHIKEALKICASQEICARKELFLKDFAIILEQQTDTQIVEKAKQEILPLYTPKLGENHPLIQKIKETHPTNTRGCTIF